MLKNHPKGLLVAFFSNMGERFGFYTMMAILVLFLQAKFGLSAEKAGGIYGWFYFSIYALALLGGILADSTKRYKLVILAGIIIMFAGYIIMAVPGMTLTITVIGLMTIALGNGLFKGNLQAVVGQMYDDPKYSKLRDTAFMIFYMGINVGAFFAPFAASGMRNWWLKVNGFVHDGSIPALCHQYINGTLPDTSVLQQLADKVNLSGPVTDLSAFANTYLEVFSKGYNYAFGIAAVAMVISLLVYLIFNKLLPNKETKVSTVSSEKIDFKPVPLIAAIAAMGIVAYGLHFIRQVGLARGFAFGLFAAFVTWIFLTSRKEERGRITALILVFIVVVFFWMSFHQNGLTLTLFARDYTMKNVGPLTNLFFTLPSMLAVIGSVAGLVMLLYGNLKRNLKITGGVLFVVAMLIVLFFTTGFNPSFLIGKLFTRFEPQNAIAPEVFQSFNPLFIVALTFPVMGAFAWMNKKGIEPSTPKKIGIGMVIAAVGFIVVLLASIGAPSPLSLKGTPIVDSARVSPCAYCCRAFSESDGIVFCFKGGPVTFPGVNAGWMAPGNGSREQPSFCRYTSLG
jgi:POT family proton-dependent oligopeptide transporter